MTHQTATAFRTQKPIQPIFDQPMGWSEYGDTEALTFDFSGDAEMRVNDEGQKIYLVMHGALDFILNGKTVPLLEGQIITVARGDEYGFAGHARIAEITCKCGG